jgi:hypothetical protein
MMEFWAAGTPQLVSVLAIVMLLLLTLLSAFQRWLLIEAPQFDEADAPLAKKLGDRPIGSY